MPIYLRASVIMLKSFFSVIMTTNHVVCFCLPICCCPMKVASRSMILQEIQFDGLRVKETLVLKKTRKVPPVGSHVVVIVNRFKKQSNQT